MDFEIDAATAELAPRLHHQHLPDTLRYERHGLDDRRRRAPAADGPRYA